MKVRAHILATALLAGAVAAAQTAPASQTVKPNPPQAPSKQDSIPAKTPAKNPFKPKPKSAQTATPAKAQSKTAAQPANTPTKAATQLEKKEPAKTPAKAAIQPAKKEPAKAPAKAAIQPAKKEPPKAPAKTADSSRKQPAPKQAPVPAQAKAAPKQEVPKPAEAKTEPASDVAQTAPKKLPSPGRRDPFVSPLASAAGRGPGAGCTTGKRCLVVDQLVLKGIVQMKTGNFALVENISKRPYVLHENDSLFNGSVVKITGDSVVFREQSNDILGRPVSKEVVKKVSAPSV